MQPLASSLLAGNATGLSQTQSADCVVDANGACPAQTANLLMSMYLCVATRLEAAELARVTDSALSLAAAPAPPLVFSEAEDEAAPADRQAWAQVGI